MVWVAHTHTHAGYIHTDTHTHRDQRGPARTIDPLLLTKPRDRRHTCARRCVCVRVRGRGWWSGAIGAQTGTDCRRRCRDSRSIRKGRRMRAPPRRGASLYTLYPPSPSLSLSLARALQPAIYARVCMYVRIYACMFSRAERDKDRESERERGEAEGSGGILSFYTRGKPLHASLVEALSLSH